MAQPEACFNDRTRTDTKSIMVYKIRLTRPKMLYFLEYISILSIIHFQFNFNLIVLSSGEKKTRFQKPVLESLKTIKSITRKQGVPNFQPYVFLQVPKASRSSNWKAMLGIDNAFFTQNECNRVKTEDYDKTWELWIGDREQIHSDWFDQNL